MPLDVLVTVPIKSGEELRRVAGGAASLTVKPATLPSYELRANINRHSLGPPRNQPTPYTEQYGDED